MTDITFEGNVMTHATAAFELWSWNGKAGDIPYMIASQTNVIQNSTLRDNYMLYMGYGFGHQRTYSEFDPEKGAKFFDGSSFWCMIYKNVVFENNVGMYSLCYGNYGRNFCTTATGSKRGVVLRNNTYIMSDKCLYTRNGRYLTEGLGGKTNYSYDLRTLAYLNSLGIESGSDFYYYEGYLYDIENEGVYH